MSLELIDIRKSFGGNVVIDGLTLKVSTEKVTSLIGPNGAGKTTIFNIITGFLRADAGTIVYQGRRIDALTPQKIAQLGVARTFQNLGLFLQMTVWENLLVVTERATVGVPISSTRRSRLQNILELTNLSGKEHKLAAELSYAEKKFLSLARVMATEAQCILLDEPASGLDGPSLAVFQKILARVTQQGATILLIEHNLDLVRSLSDEVVFLDIGRVIAHGAPNLVFSLPEVAKLYFGITKRQ